MEKREEESRRKRGSDWSARTGGQSRCDAKGKDGLSRWRVWMLWNWARRMVQVQKQLKIRNQAPRSGVCCMLTVVSRFGAFRGDVIIWFITKQFRGTVLYVPSFRGMYSELSPFALPTSHLRTVYKLEQKVSFMSHIIYTKKGFSNAATYCKTVSAVNSSESKFLGGGGGYTVILQVHMFKNTFEIRSKFNWNGRLAQ